MAGESPGREQQQETSGPVGDRPTADPRLAVFRAPLDVREAAVTSDVREQHGSAARAAVPPVQAEADDPPGSGARPHPASASPSAALTNTPNDVAAVDAPSDVTTSLTPPSPRSPEAVTPGPEPSEPGPEPEAESNRDLSEAGDAAGDAAGDTVEDADRVLPEEERASAVSAGGASEEADAAEAEDAADGSDSGTGDAEDSAGDAEPSADADPEDAAPENDADAAPEDAGPADDAPDEPAVEDARPQTRTAEDAKPSDAKPSGGSTSVLRPLVSDLPGERPAGQGAGGASGARSTPSPASAPYSAPPVPAAGSTPRTGPVKAPEPAKPAESAESSRPPAPAPLPPHAVKASAIGTPTAAGAPAAAPESTPGAAPDGPDGPEGTRAMAVPLPPEPEVPLKLLAELTNTPPPKQTVLRTVGRRFKIWTPLVLLLAVVFCVVQALRPLPSPSMSLTAAPSYTFAGAPLPASMPWPAQGQSVAEVEGLGSLGVHGAQTPVPIASVTKVMTAYLILRDHPLTGKNNGPVITVDAQAAGESASTDESTAKVKEGQKFTERQMLQLLLIPSGNNIARLLARWDSGSQEAFVAKMTKAAADLDMTRTTYTGASGFESTTKSTAVDQLKLARQVMKNDVFRAVVAQPNIDIPGVGTIYNNNNDLVHAGVVGIKTGSSTPAGGALMWAAKKKAGGREQLILGVVLQQRGGTTVYDSLQAALVNSQKLIDSVQGGLTSVTIVKKGQVVGRIDDGLGGTTPVVAGKDLTAVGWAGMRTDLTLTAGAGGLPHNAKAGTRVGTVGFGSGQARTTVPVVLQSDLKEPSFGKKLTRTG